jgi:hypothetical protein
MIHVSHYIISYFAMLIGYVWPLNLLTNYASIVLKRNLEKKHLNIYQSIILSTKILIHTISVTDSFLLQIYIYKYFIFKYLMIRCFYYFLVDHNNNIRCTMILHIFLLFNCKYYFYYFDHVFVLSGYIQLNIMVTRWQFSLLII